MAKALVIRIPDAGADNVQLPDGCIRQRVLLQICWHCLRSLRWVHMQLYELAIRGRDRVPKADKHQVDVGRVRRWIRAREGHRD